eukprot:gene42024-52092_t
MLKDLSIKKKLYFGFGAILAIITLLLLVAYNNFNRLSEANGWDRHTMDVLLSIDRVSNDILEVQAESRGYYLTGDPTRAARIKGELEEVAASLLKARELTRDNPAQLARLAKVRAQVDQWVKEVLEPQVARRAQLGDAPGAADAIGRAPESQLKQGSPLIRSIHEELEAASADETRLLAARTKESAELQRSMLLVLLAGGALCIVLGAMIAYVLSQALMAPLTSLTQAVGRIAAGDIGARAAVISGDELGQVTTEFNRMAQAMQDSQAKELADTNLLRAKVDSLLEVVSKAASGDLTGK